MSNLHTKISASSTKQSGRRSTVRTGAPRRWGQHWWGLLSLAACASGGDDTTLPTDAPPATGSVLLPVSDIPIDDAFIYITPEGSLDGVDLAQIDLSSLVLDGGGDTTLINLGDLDASEVSIVTNSAGKQVFAVSRAAAINRASAETSSAPVSYNLAASQEINFIDTRGDSQTIEAHEVIADGALKTDPGFIAVIKALPDVEGTSAQLAATTVDLSEVFLSTSDINFSAVDDEGKAIALSDKNGDGVVAEFTLGELVASTGNSGAITVRAAINDEIFSEQTFSVVVAQVAVDTPFVGDGSVVTITDGSTSSASVVVLPLSGGDGVITYALEGENKDSGGFFILQGRLFFSADLSGTYKLVATDIDGDEASITIDFTIPDNEVSIANPLAAQTHVGNVGEVTVNLAGVFDGGDGDLTLTSGARTITSNTLTIDTSTLNDGDNAITVTAKDSDGDIAIDTFVLTVNKSPTVATTIPDDIALASVNGNFSSPDIGADITINLLPVFGGGSDSLSYATSLGSISSGELTIALGALNGGDNTISVTATDANGDEVIDVFVLTSSSLAVSGLIDTSSLGAHGFIIQGDAEEDYFGESVSAAGDINGDGFADLIVGAYLNDGGDAGGKNAGEAYVIWGQADINYGVSGSNGRVLDTTNLGDAGFIIQGDADFDYLGRSVSAAGDINGDGYADLIVGAYGGSGGGSNTGEAYVIWGQANKEYGTVGSDGRRVVDTGSLGDAGFIIQGDGEDDRFGFAVSAAGDVNGDGYADLIVGANQNDGGGSDAGEAYVIWGQGDKTYGTIDSDGQRVLNISDLGDAGFIIQDDAANDYLGISVSAAGDVDGDGYADLIVGAIQFHADGGNAGEAYVIWGQDNKEYGTVGSDGRRVVDTSSLSDAGFVIQGDATVNFFGIAVSSAGDINGDGYADLIVGAHPGFSGDPVAGEAYVIWGQGVKTYGTLGSDGRRVLDITDLGDAGFIIRGGAGDVLGASVSAAGDVNGDGYGDLIVGAPGGDAGGSNAGKAYVIWGKSDKDHGTLGSDGRWVVDASNLGDAGFTIQGDAANDELGRSVSAAGDINGDGYADLIVGASLGDKGVPDAGAAYVIWGGAHLSGYRLGYDPDSTNQPKREFEATGETTDYSFDFSDLFTNANGAVALSYRDTESGSNDENGSGATAGAATWDAATNLLSIDLSAIAEDFDIIITATDDAGDTALWRIAVADTPPTIVTSISDDLRATNHNDTTIDLAAVFASVGGNLTYAVTASNGGGGVNLTGSALTIDYSTLGTGTHTVTVTATDAENANSITEVFVVEVIKHHDNSLGSNALVMGTTYADDITGNSFAATGNLVRVDLDGGAGDDTISGNALTAAQWLYSATFDGGDGDDTISGNTLTATWLYSITFAGGDGDDTISGNTISATHFDVSYITFHGGAGNDTISDNHIVGTGTDSYYNIISATLMGGAGDDVFRDNSATQANGELASLTIDGGDGEDTAVFRLFSGEYAGISNWINSSDGGATVTLTGDGAAVTLIDVETITFADGTSYSVADAGVEGNGGILYDLANAFPDADPMATTYTANNGTIGNDNTLTLAGTELIGGGSTIVITATASDNSKTTETITINAVKTLKIIGAEQHDQQTIDLDAIFVDENTYTYTYTSATGISLNGSTLTFDNTNSALSTTTHYVTITATDASNVVADTHTLTYALDAIKDQSGDSSDTTYTGTTLADAITGNSFSTSTLTNVDLDGGVGDDTLSCNTLTGNRVYSVTFDGAAGDDTISNNTLINTTLTLGTDIFAITFAGDDGNDTISGNTFTGYTVFSVAFVGGADDDTISDNTFTASNNMFSSTFDGGEGNDTISGNTLVADFNVYTITFQGGAGNDTISDNHIESTTTQSDYGISSVTLMGGAGDDVFRDNSATQANGGSASLTIDGGDGEDTVVFRSIADEYAGISEWTDEVTTITLLGDGAAVTLIDVETITFADGVSYNAADAWVEGNGGILYDLTNAFPDADNTTTYASDSGIVGIGIGHKTLILTGTELANGANIIEVTATTGDSVTTETITINAVKTLKIAGAKQHDEQTIDLNAIFVDANTYVYTSTPQSGISLSDSTLTFDNNNAALTEGEHTIIITATDGSDVGTHTLTYGLDTIKDQSDGTSDSSYTGTNYADAITGNSFSATNLTIVELYGEVGNDTISGNTLTGDRIYSITFEGGAGNDAISNNTLTAADDVFSITFHGQDGDDTFSGNTISAEYLDSIELDGGAGNDTISNNSLISNYGVWYATFNGGDGDDTISDNHIESTGTASNNDVYRVTLMGGAGNDVFRNNTAIQANGELAALTIDGGDGEDTVVFRSLIDEYDGLSEWIDISNGGGTSITLTGDGAAAILINIETIAFADGASYSTSDIWVEGNGGISYDLANVFPDADTTSTTYTANSGTITDDFLNLAGTELTGGSNIVVITATASDSTETTETITINAVKTLEIAGLMQHDQQTLDLDAIFVDANTYAYTSTPPIGISLSDSILSFDNTHTALTDGEHTITITATDGSDVFTHTLTYALDTIKDQSGDSSHTTYTGTTYADAITGNSFSGGSLSYVYLDGGDGNDTISDNTLTSTVYSLYSVTFDGGAGDDIISNNTLNANWNPSSINFDGGAGDDTISGNTLTGDSTTFVHFDGGAGDDTISNNTLTANDVVREITFDGGDGNDTISDNHLVSSETDTNDDVYRVTLMGGAGDDVFSGNTATQANGELSSVTIDGGAGDDRVDFALASSMFTIKFDGEGASDSNITVTDNAKRTEAADGVDSYAEYVLIDIEELYFNDTLYVFS